MWPFLRGILRIPISEARVNVRGFRRGSPESQRRRENIGIAFLNGYRAALETEQLEELGVRLSEIELEDRGFAFEGAAMALALLDRLNFSRKRRLAEFLRGVGERHVYMVHVGAGWAMARIPWLRLAPERYTRGFDPLLRWLMFDGFGFHEGYFHWPKVSRKRASGLRGYAARAFDQGLGRSIWFVEACEAKSVAAAVRRFDASRHADLWSGVGLACAYAGGASSDEIEQLLEHAKEHPAAFAQGVAFAAGARVRAGNPAAHTDLACRIACGMGIREAAAVTDQALENLPAGGIVPAYEVWRTRIQQRLGQGVLK
jgi:enediyne biosynthesis protein E3